MAVDGRRGDDFGVTGEADQDCDYSAGHRIQLAIGELSVFGL